MSSEPITPPIEPTEPTPEPTPAEQRLADLGIYGRGLVEAEIDKLMSDAVESGRQAGVREGRKLANEELLGRVAASEVRLAFAARGLDPSLVRGGDWELSRRLIGLDAVPTTPSGDVDPAVIAAAVDAFATEHPNMLTRGTGAPRSVEQGPRGSTAVTRDTLGSMTAEQIAKALEEGRLDGLLGRR